MDNIVSFYRERLNLQKANFSHIEHEDAMVATVFKVTQPNGIRIIPSLSTSELTNFKSEAFMYTLSKARIFHTFSASDKESSSA